MKGIQKKEVVEDFAMIGGLIGMQFIYAGNSVLASYLMSLGFKPSSLVILSSFATFLILSPFSYFFERSQWPKQMSLKLLIQLMLISFGGVTLFQSLYIKGINLTSPAMATAMPNLAPGLIFLIAWAFGLEKVELRCKYSKVKIVGTLLCITGAILMSLMQSISNAHIPGKEAQFSLPSPPHDDDADIFNEEKIRGSIYLMAAILVLSSSVVLQATTLGDFPAPISLSAITSFIGMALTVIVELVQEHCLEIGFPLNIRDLIGFSLLEDMGLSRGKCRAGIVSGICISFNNWAMKKRGPVLVSVFSPIGTVLAVVLSTITLRDSITLGSLAGMFLMFIGLYFVLWAKGKEGYLISSSNSSESDEYDVEKPLLS